MLDLRQPRRRIVGLDWPSPGLTSALLRNRRSNRHGQTLANHRELRSDQRQWSRSHADGARSTESLACAAPRESERVQTRDSCGASFANLQMENWRHDGKQQGA